MLDSYPIVLKELIQSAHRRRMYVIRAALPVVALVILTPQVLAALALAGQDWRQIAGIARPLFKTCSWIQFLVFMVLAAEEAASSLRRESSQRTLELLCATPLSYRGIVYGKFLSALGKVFLIGLALLPIMGVWFRLGRVPPGMALGSLGIIAGNTMLCAGLGMVDGALARPGRGKKGSALGIVLLYFIVVSAIGAALDRKRLWLFVAMPFGSFSYVMNDRAPAGMSPGVFAALAAAVPFAIGLLALLASPWLFRRTFERYMGSHATKRRRRRFAPDWLRRLAPRRPPLKPHEDPFFWQEKGAATLVLRWGLWLIYAIVAVVVVILFFFGTPMEFLAAPEFYMAMAIVGVVWATIGSGLYATHVFAREKERRTAESLVLTGADPRRIYLAKLRAVLRALRGSFVGTAVPLGVYIALGAGKRDFSWSVVWFVVLYGLVGPPAAAVIGMVFSAAAKSASGALGGIMLSPVFSWLLSAVLLMPLGGMMALLFALGRTGGALGLVAVLFVGLLTMRMMAASTWVWKVWRLSFLLAINYLVASAATGLPFLLLAKADLAKGSSPTLFASVWLLASLSIAAASGMFWFRFGARIFESSMLGQPQAKRRMKAEG